MILYTNRHPTKCANDIDKASWKEWINHYLKILSSVHKLLDNTDIKGVAPYTENSPDVLWVRNSKQHYDWLFDCLCQLLVLERKYNPACNDRTKSLQCESDTANIMALIRAPHNLLNHGWADPYSPDHKPYRKAAVETWKQWLAGGWTASSIHPKWPQGQPEWVEYDQERCVYIVKEK